LERIFKLDDLLVNQSILAFDKYNQPKDYSRLRRLIDNAENQWNMEKITTLMVLKTHSSMHSFSQIFSMISHDKDKGGVKDDTINDSHSILECLRTGRDCKSIDELEHSANGEDYILSRKNNKRSSSQRKIVSKEKGLEDDHAEFFVSNSINGSFVKIADPCLLQKKRTHSKTKKTQEAKSNTGKKQVDFFKKSTNRKFPAQQAGKEAGDSKKANKRIVLI